MSRSGRSGSEPSRGRSGHGAGARPEGADRNGGTGRAEKAGAVAGPAAIKRGTIAGRVRAGGGRSLGGRVRTIGAVVLVAYNRFVLHDGWAIASHIALSILTSFFPFLILLAAVASVVGSVDLADRAADILLDVWPETVAGPIANEVHSILTGRRSDILTVGAVLALYFSSNGVESLRVGLNRAYGVRERRSWWLTRIESILYVLVGVVVMLAFAVGVVLGPLLWRNVVAQLPALAPFGWVVDSGRLGVTALLLVAALVIAHKYLAAGRRPVRAVLPGVAVTLALWFVGGLGFGWYLERFPGAYASMYGGLATAMIALIFLYTLAAIFLFGGELNSAIIAARRHRLPKVDLKNVNPAP